MSDIPRARAILQRALDAGESNDKFVRACIRQALALLDREKPTFKTERKLPPLTREQVAMAIDYREQGLPLNEIARKLGTNIGRVSEAINGLRQGI